MKNIEEKKEIGNYKIIFKTKFDKSKSDKIILEVALSKDLQSLIKKAIISEKTPYSFYDGVNNIDGQRYKVKTWVYNTLYSRGRELLFDEVLIDKSKKEFEFLSVDLIDDNMDKFKENIKQLIRNMLKYSNINMVVNFNIDKKSLEE